MPLPTAACPTTHTGHTFRSFRAWVGMLRAGAPGPWPAGPPATPRAVGPRAAAPSGRSSGTARTWLCWRGAGRHHRSRPLPLQRRRQPPLGSPLRLPPTHQGLVQPSMSNAAGTTGMVQNAVNQAPTANSRMSGTPSVLRARLQQPYLQRRRQRQCPPPQELSQRLLPPAPASAHALRVLRGKDPSVNLLLRLEETPTFAARTSAVLDRTFLEGVAPVRPVAGAEQSRVNLASIALARMDGRSAFPLPRARARRPTAPSPT
mmetsp:Transcript_43658/g.104117  ORF Transcript_43658/g.104117 Transcript_43658/m.104117 type:complete len:261 (+) Transcript_43658:750-1532(+)